MADRYWVGGSGTWNTTSTTNWSATSGGSGGASAPTVSDNVYFDQAGTYTVTVSNSKCLNITVSAGTVSFSGFGALVEVRGSLSFIAGTTWTTNSGTLTFSSTLFGTFITTNGTTLTASNVTFNGAGGGWILGSALTVSSALNITQGTINTSPSGNYSITAGGDINSTGTLTRGISLNASTVSTAGGINFAGSGLTFNAGTSQINLSSDTGALTGAGYTFYNVAFTGSGAAGNTRSIANALGTAASITLNNLSITGPSTTGRAIFNIATQTIINGVFSTAGTAGNRRIFVLPAAGSPGESLIVNSAPSLTDVDFQYISAYGSAAPISGTRIGNRGNCKGITFSTPKTVYWNLAGAQNWSATAWATTPTGTPSTDNFPLPQDTAAFTDSGSVTGTITLDSAFGYVSSVDMSARTSAMTLSVANGTSVYGNWVNGSGTTISGTSTLTFTGGTTQTITSAGKVFSCPITVDTYGGTVQLGDALDIGSNTLTVTNGTFNSGSYGFSAGAFSSSSSNVRAVNFGSGTITLTSNSPISISTVTNLTFNAGTSQINLTASGTSFSTGGLTFYNVSFTSTNVNTATIIGANTFNNLTFAAPASTGSSKAQFYGNNTVNGTLTVSGSSPTSRIFVQSDALGTTRTLTVNSLSATDCDFRDIVITGAAAGSSPTRAGNCGGNSGITFPTPKTVYWNLAGTQNWSATAWASSSGGTPDVNNFPLAQDTAVFDNTGAAGTVTVDQSWNVGTFDASARTSAMTLTIGTQPYFHGDWKFGTGVTSTSSGGTVTFAKRATQTITSNGVTFGCSVQVWSPSGTVQLADALTLNSARTLTIWGGTFDAVTYNVTCGLFSSSTSIARTLKMGSGTWTLSGTGTVWDCGTTTNLTLSKSTANIVLSDTSTSSRTFAGGSQAYNKITIGGSTGTSTLTITGNNTIGELASTKTVAHTIALGTTTQTFGKWTVTGTSGNVVTLTGTGTTHLLAGSCTSGIDYLAMGSIGFSSSSPAEFYAGANSTGTASAPVYRTAKPADSVRYWVGGTGNWSSTARWSASSGGASGASVPRSHDDVVFDSSSNATDYTATIDTVTGGVRMKSLTISGPASGNLTLNNSDVICGIHGSVTLPATGLVYSYSGSITLSGSSTGLTFTSNGLVINSGITINGVGSSWSLGSALSNSTSSITVLNGAFNTAGYNVSMFNFVFNGTGDRTISLGNSSVTVNSLLHGPQTSNSAANLVFNAGTSSIDVANSSGQVQAQGVTFNNLTFSSTGPSTNSITGECAFNNLTFAAITSAALRNVSVQNNVTVAGTLTIPANTGYQRNFIRSSAIGTPVTFNVAAFSGGDCDFRDIAVTGAAAPISGTRLGNCGGNSGITFPSPKTVYWNQFSGGNWYDNAWSSISGGTPDPSNFPLPQDTAVFDFGGLNNGASVDLSTQYNVGTIDMSARISRTMTLTVGSTSTTTPAMYGSWINGTGTTVSGTGQVSFLGRGTMFFVSAGKTTPFPITVDAFNGTFQVYDNFASSNTLTHTSGTINLNNLTLVCTTFSSSNSNSRTITMGSGKFELTGTGTVWNVSTSTNLTLNKGTSTIFLNNGTTADRTFAGGNLSYGKLIIGGQYGISTTTITGNNSFTEIASTKIVPHTISLGTTTQTVGSWTASGTTSSVVTISGSTKYSPCNLVLSGAGPTTNLFCLSLVGVRSYPLTNTWYAGTSNDYGSLGWTLTSDLPPSLATGNFFMLLMGA